MSVDTQLLPGAQVNTWKPREEELLGNSVGAFWRDIKWVWILAKFGLEKNSVI